MEAMPGSNNRDLPDNSVTMTKATFHHQPEPPTTFTGGYNVEKTREPMESQTHSMVIVDESPENSPEFQKRTYDYETQSDSLKFNEESPEWESMDIQLRIDPSGKQEPIITRREKPREDDNGEIQRGFFLKYNFCFYSFLLKKVFRVFIFVCVKSMSLLVYFRFIRRYSKAKYRTR